MADRAQQVEESAPAAKSMAQKSGQTPQGEEGSFGSVLGQARGVRVPPVPHGPADLLAVQRIAGNRAARRMLTPFKHTDSIQRLGEGPREPSDEEIHSAAAKGVSTPATTLPYLDRIQASFGRHSIGHIKAHIGPEASQASREMNALAFASGDHVVFGGTPDLHTTAHEAAHVVQQRAGVQLSGDIGREGDSYEHHAEAVAKRVTRGEPAEDLLDEVTASGIASKAVQRLIYLYDKEQGVYRDSSHDQTNFMVGHVTMTGPLFIVLENRVNIVPELEDAIKTLPHIIKKRKVQGEVEELPNEHDMQQVIDQLFPVLPGTTADKPYEAAAVRLRNAVGSIYKVDDTGSLKPLDDVKDLFLNMIVANAYYKKVQILPSGGGSRLPKAKGNLLLRDDYTKEQFADILDLNAEDIEKVTVEPKSQTDLDSDPLTHGNAYAYVIDGRRVAIYKSEAVLSKVVRKRFACAGRELTEEQIPQNATDLYEKLKALSRPASNRDWIPADNLTTIRRGDGQESAMKGWNAAGAAAVLSQKHQLNLDLDQSWEWLHVQGAQIGGATDGTNLVTGLFVVNSLMIPFENQIKEWANESARGDGPAGERFKAKFDVEGEDHGMAKKIILSIKAANHQTLPDVEMRFVEFLPLEGKVVDRLAGSMLKRIAMNRIPNRQT